MRRILLGLAGVVAGLSGCATSRAPEGTAGYPAIAREAAPAADPQALGRPVEQLGAGARAQVAEALQQRGLLDTEPLPGEMRQALIALQTQNDLAPTGWVDEDTVRLLGLPVNEVLPVVAGAGAYRGSSATLGDLSGSQVGGEPGPANPVPDAVEVGAAETAGAEDPVFQYDEARRLRAAARVLRGKAEREGGERADALHRQADKADHVFRLHADRLQELGGESAIAGLELEPAETPEAVAGVEEGKEVRAAHPVGGEDQVALSPSEIERMQRTLWAEGFLHQAPTAAIDAPTRQALRAFQTAQGWNPTGAVDERTARLLITSPESRQPQGLEPPGSPQPGGAAPPGEGASGAGSAGEDGGEGAESREHAPAR